MTHMVRPEEMEAVMADITNLTRAIVAAVEEADATSARMHQVWAGESAEAHQDTHEVWRGDAEVLLAAANEIGLVLSRAHGNYTSAVAANLTMWS